MQKIFRGLLPFVLSGLPLFAQAACNSTDTGLCNPLGYSDLATFLKQLLQIVAQIGFPVIVLFMVYIGFLYISAEGKPEKITKVHQFFFWALVGALLILGAEALSIAIQATVGQLSQGVQ
jgi:hypothetical protein